MPRPVATAVFPTKGREETIWSAGMNAANYNKRPSKGRRLPSVNDIATFRCSQALRGRVKYGSCQHGNQVESPSEKENGGPNLRGAVLQAKDGATFRP